MYIIRDKYRADYYYRRWQVLCTYHGLTALVPLQMFFGMIWRVKQFEGVCGAEKSCLKQRPGFLCVCINSPVGGQPHAKPAAVDDLRCWGGACTRPPRIEKRDGALPR